MKIGYAQFEPKIGDYEANIAAMRQMATDAAGANLLVFPELALSGYDFANLDDADRAAEIFGDGPSSESLLALANEHRMTLIAGYPERSPEGLYNSALIALPDGRLHNYRKLHLFSREKLFFLPGDAPPPVIDTPAGRVGVMICFDWLFPETARLLALDGAQIIAHPSNLVMPYCQKAMYCRSVENRVFTITANRIGTESTGGRVLTFTGASQVLNPDGQILVQAPIDRPHLGLTEIDPAAADSKRINEFNDLAEDRRVEFYAPLVDF